MGEYRRMKRKMERDIKKKGKMLNIPTEKDVEEYIMNKIKETNGKEKVRS